MNRRGPGRKRCCHTEALHAGYHVYSSHGWFLSRIIELVYFHTENHGVHGCQSRIFFFLSRIIELFFSHGASQMVTVLLSRDLSFGPTDQREVICELSNFSSHGESRRSRSFHTSFLFVPNYRIIELFFFTRSIAEVTVLLSRICELSNFSSHGESRRVTGFCHETCPLDPLTNGR